MRAKVRALMLATLSECSNLALLTGRPSQRRRRWAQRTATWSYPRPFPRQVCTSAECTLSGRT